MICQGYHHLTLVKHTNLVVRVQWLGKNEDSVNPVCARYCIAGALFSDSFFCFSHLSAQSFVGLVLFFVDLIRTNRVVNKRNKAFCRNEHLFRIEFGFTSTFPVMSLPNFRQKNPLAEWLLLLLMLRFSINSINVQFLGFGFALSSCVLCTSSNDYVFHCFYK